MSLLHRMKKHAVPALARQMRRVGLSPFLVAVTVSAVAVKTYHDPATNTQVEAYFPKVEIEGRAGARAAIWAQSVAGEPMIEVVIILQKLAGDRDCYLVLRNGENGDPLEHGKRVFLKDGPRVEVGWYLNNLRLGDQPLVLEIANGLAQLEEVRIHRRR